MPLLFLKKTRVLFISIWESWFYQFLTITFQRYIIIVVATVVTITVATTTACTMTDILGTMF